MKKIAFFVEGQTEMFFINRLLIEIAGQKNISIQLIKLIGGKTVPKLETIIPQSLKYVEPTNPKFYVLIYDSSSDNKVQSDILDNLSNLKLAGYTEIIGLRDLFPSNISDLENLKKGIEYFKNKNKPLLIDYKIVIAVHEIEAWFISEHNHFLLIDTKLNCEFINEKLGINLNNDDISLLYNPAKNLGKIYNLAGKGYGKTKQKKQVERTIEFLDYSNLYLNIRNKNKELNELLTYIDDFFV